MSNDFIYLDHAATSYPTRYFAKDFYVPGNANSNHILGLKAYQKLKEAKNRVKKVLGVETGEVLFDGNASELIDSIFSLVQSYDKLYYYNIVTSPYEHDSIFKWGDSEAYYDNIVPEKQPPCPIIYCHMAVNNITGDVYNVEYISKRVREKVACYFFVDATALIGHWKIPENLDTFCDVFVASAHKFHGPQGSGFVWLSDRFTEFLRNIRSDWYDFISHGTPDVPTALATTEALEYAVANLPGKLLKWHDLNYRLLDELKVPVGDFSKVSCAITNFAQKNRTPAINALWIPDANGDALAQYLSTQNIYVSPGHSACASDEDYRVLEAMGFFTNQAKEVIRVSYSDETTESDIVALAREIKKFREIYT